MNEAKGRIDRHIDCVIGIDLDKNKNRVDRVN